MEAEGGARALARRSGLAVPQLSWVRVLAWAHGLSAPGQGLVLVLVLGEAQGLVLVLGEAQGLVLRLVSAGPGHAARAWQPWLRAWACGARYLALPPRRSPVLGAPTEDAPLLDGP